MRTVTYYSFAMVCIVKTAFVGPAFVNRILVEGHRMIVNRMADGIEMNRKFVSQQYLTHTQEFQFQKFQHNRPLNRAPLSEKSHK